MTAVHRPRTRLVRLHIPEGFRYVALEILSHVVRHSDARDTKDGIQRWWLGTQPVPEVLLRRALEYLTSMGLLTAIQSTAGEATYGLNRFRMDEAIDTLREYRDTIQ